MQPLLKMVSLNIINLCSETIFTFDVCVWIFKYVVMQFDICLLNKYCHKNHMQDINVC